MLKYLLGKNLLSQVLSGVSFPISDASKRGGFLIWAGARLLFLDHWLPRMA